MIVIYKHGQDLQVTKKSLKLKLDMVMHRQTSLVQQLAVKQLQVIYNTIRKVDRMNELFEQQEKISEILFDLEDKQLTNTKEYQIYLKKFDDLQEQIENESWKRNQPI